MPVINRIAAFADDMKTWRQHIHAHPELGFDCFETAGFVKERLIPPSGMPDSRWGFPSGPISDSMW